MDPPLENSLRPFNDVTIAKILLIFNFNIKFYYRFERRLLHPGANTSDILTQYVSAIRALHVLDPAGVILEHVCTPVRQYLR